MASQSILSFVAIALFVIGIAGNGFEMRKIRMSTKDGEIVSKNTFFDRRTFKWYVLIGIALALLAVSDLY